MNLKDLSNLNVDNLSVVITLNNNYSNELPDLRNKKIVYLNFSDLPIKTQGLIEKRENSFVQTFYLEDVINSLLPKNYDVTNIMWARNLFLTTLGVARAETLGSEELYLPDSFFANVVKPNFYEKLNLLANEGTISETKIKIKSYALPNKGAKIPAHIILKNKSLVLTSGGTDNVVAALIEKNSGKEIGLLQVIYQQAARYQESWCVDRIKEDLKVEDFKRINLDVLKHYGGSALLRDDMQLREGTLHLEYVPFRNSILGALGLIYAASRDYSSVVLGMHPDDTMAPDGSIIYLNKFNNLMNEFNFRTPKISAPLLYFGGKPELIKLGMDLGVNFKHTWSCHTFVPESEVGYDVKACGTCGTCSTRFSAFQKIGAEDPIDYIETPKLRNKWAGPQEKYDEISKLIFAGK